MPYATQQSLQDRFGPIELAQLTDPAAGQVINEVTVARAIADASAEIDSHLGARYALPLASAPEVLVRVCCDMARYYLWDQAAPEAVRTRYQSAVSLLKLLGNGQASLAGVAELAPATGAVTVSVSAPARQFSDAMLDTFAPRG